MEQSVQCEVVTDVPVIITTKVIEPTPESSQQLDESNDDHDNSYTKDQRPYAKQKTTYKDKESKILSPLKKTKTNMRYLRLDSIEEDDGSPREEGKRTSI